MTQGGHPGAKQYNWGVGCLQRCGLGTDMRPETSHIATELRLAGLLMPVLLVACVEGPPQLHGYPSEEACLADEALYESLPLPDSIKRLFISRESLLVKETALYPCGEAVATYRQEWERYYGASKDTPTSLK